jgi:hypothetical protein
MAINKSSELKLGNELQLMLDGKKPMAVFYRATFETFDETGGQPFDNFVSCGKIEKNRFFILNEGQSYRLIYTVYTLPGEEWRFQLYKKMKKIGQTHWCKELETIEGCLLGY